MIDDVETHICGVSFSFPLSNILKKIFARASDDLSGYWQ